MRSPYRRHDLPFLYKYTSAATAKVVLGTNSLRWSSPLLFNDPFDVPRRFDLPFTAEDLRSALASRIEAYISGAAEPQSETAFSIMASLTNEDPSRRHLMLDILRDSIHLLTIPTTIGIEQFRSSWDEKVRILRIVCFSAIADSATMWAHYGDNHKGVVLQFECVDERDSSFLLASPVIYRSAPPTLPIVDRWARAFLGEEDIDWSDYFHEYYYVKSEEWGYEQEYRAISAALGESELYHDSPFLAEDLRGVIFGTSISAEDEQAIRRLAAAYPNATVYHASADHQTRRITFG